MKRAGDGLLLVLLVLVVLSYFRSAQVPGTPWFSREPSGHYALQAEGFRRGQLHAAIEPQPELLALPDPYDPIANAAYRVHDMSLWNGKYYLYFGPAPILLLILPCRWLTGFYPAEFLVVPTFCGVGFLFAVVALRAAHQRLFPRAHAGVVLLLVGALGWGNPALHLNHAVQFYQVPIACAYALGMAALWAFGHALAGEKVRLRWIVVGSLCLGGALAARPNYAFGVAGALAVAALGLHRPTRQRLPVWLLQQRRLVLGLAGPVVAIGVGLLIFNQLRFGDPFEFGTRYQLAGSNQFHLEALHPRHVPAHGWAYLFAPVVWQPYFPFLDVAPGQPVGVLRYLPLSVVSLWLLVLLWNQWASERRWDGFVVWAGMVLAIGAGNLLAISAVAFPPLLRYAADFAPYFLLAGSLVVLRWSHASSHRRAVIAVGGALAAWGIALVTAVHVANTPVASRSLDWARRFNVPTAWWQQLRGYEHGPLRLHLRLPEAGVGQDEPLVQSGFTPDRRNWVLLRFLSRERVALVYFHAGLGELVSDPFAVPAGREVMVEIRSGMLLPPVTHPIYRGWPAEAVREARGEVSLLVEGRELLRAFAEAYPSRPSDLEIGVLGLAAGAEPRRHFSGQILQQERVPLHVPATVPRVRALPAGPLRLELILPAVSHGYDPLLATGSGRQSDLIYAVYATSPAGPTVSLGFDHFGVGGPLTTPVRYDPQARHVLTVWMGSWAARLPERAGRAWARRLVLVFNGDVLADEDVEFYAAGESLIVGENRHGAGSAGLAFGGRILSVEEVPLAELGAAAPESAGWGR